MRRRKWYLKNDDVVIKKLKKRTNKHNKLLIYTYRHTYKRTEAAAFTHTHTNIHYVRSNTNAEICTQKHKNITQERGDETRTFRDTRAAPQFILVFSGILQGHRRMPLVPPVLSILMG